MRWFQKLQRLDLTAGTMCLLLAVGVLSASLYSNWLGVHVSLYTADRADQVGPYETITLKFSQAVKAEVVQSELKFQPSVLGKFDWQNDHTLLFIPASPYPKNLTIHLGQSQMGSGGVWLRRDATWKLTVRQPSVVYLSYSKPQRELMVIPATGGTPRQLTYTGGKVFDFDTSPTGDQIVYSIVNDQKGLDLWLVGRDGQGAHRLLDCGTARCYSPAWSPDGKLIAYNRELAALTPTAPMGAPRPRIVDMTAETDGPVFSDPQSIGTGVMWSPDGTWLSTYDSVAGQIRVVNLRSGQLVQLPSVLGMLGSWSPDSTKLLYPNTTTGADQITRTNLYLADFKSGEVGLFIGNGSDPVDYDYGNPAWSPTGDQVLLDMRADPKRPDRQLWLYHPATMDGLLIAHQVGYSYDLFRWDPWGTRLVIQATELNKTFSPQIVVWQSGQPLKVIAENGLFPHWLP